MNSLYDTAREHPEIYLITVNTDDDHVHMQLEIAPSVSVASAIQRLGLGRGLQPVGQPRGHVLRSAERIELLLVRVDAGPELRRGRQEHAPYVVLQRLHAPPVPLAVLT